MRPRRWLTPLLFVSFAGSISPEGFYSSYFHHYGQNIGCNNVWLADHHASEPGRPPGIPVEVFEDPAGVPDDRVVKTPEDGGIKIDIAEKYADRFEKWKAELLSTGFGRHQWNTYANDKHFVLTITISEKVGKGAGTGRFLWDEDGRFVGATITLGSELDRGYPGPVYYPVMNSLSLDETTFSIDPRILAATKLSHEIGHVNQTARANGALLRLQDKLMPVYNSMFLKNGLKTSDKKLVDLATQMGGTPIEIWESREYWSEIDAMAFLKERIDGENFYCHVFNKIRQNVEEYARAYKDRFEKSPGFISSPCWN